MILGLCISSISIECFPTTSTAYYHEYFFQEYKIFYSADHPSVCKSEV